MKKFSKILVGLLVVVCIVEGFFLYRAYAIPSTTLQTARKINRIEQIIDKYYKGSVKKSDLEDYTYKGLVAGLGDVYSTYYSESDFKELEESTSGVYYGVGIYMTQDIKTGIITVVKPVKGSPADGSGLKKGDVLIKVGNYKVKTSDALDDIVKKIKGAEGTKVNLTFTRNQTTKTYTFTRQSIENPTVETKMLKDQIGYLQVTEFDEVTVSQFKSGLASLKKQGAKKLIIDLRDNPGGLLTSVVDIASQILPKGTIVYTEDKYGNRQEEYSDAEHYFDGKMAVLVNGNSASASEIFAGAIKDYGVGTLIGTQTFGKGIVQSLFPLSDGSAIKITVSRYYTPAGNNIHEVGIAPDIVLDKDTESADDNQLQKAIEVLSE